MLFDPGLCSVGCSEFAGGFQIEDHALFQEGAEHEVAIEGDTDNDTDDAGFGDVPRVDSEDTIAFLGKHKPSQLPDTRFLSGSLAFQHIDTSEHTRRCASVFMQKK